MRTCDILHYCETRNVHDFTSMFELNLLSARLVEPWMGNSEHVGFHHSQGGCKHNLTTQSENTIRQRRRRLTTQSENAIKGPNFINDTSVLYTIASSNLDRGCAGHTTQCFRMLKHICSFLLLGCSTSISPGVASRDVLLLSI